MPPIEGTDESGRYFSPYIERGADGLPVKVDIPTLADMNRLDADELAATAARFGYVDSIDQRIGAQRALLEKWNYDPGDKAAWARGMEGLAAQQEKALLGVARRAAQRHETLVAIDGDTGRMMIYINESTDPCDECAPLGGTTGTYAEFVEAGNLPGDRCLGGDRCQCALVEFE